MPQFTEETFAYEILLRFGEGDATKGKLTGAHYQTITQVKRDGLIISSQIDTPQQLALIEGESGQMLSEVLGEVNAATIIENQTLTATLVSTQQQFAAAQEVADAKIADLTARLEQELAAAQASEQAVAEVEAQPAE